MAANNLHEILAAKTSISLPAYLKLCAQHSRFGYYQTVHEIGADFVTAPHVSPLFGECLAIWFYQAWRDLGSPRHVSLVELGPGHGVLMRDMLKTLQKIDLNLFRNLTVYLIERSKTLKSSQAENLMEYKEKISWVNTLECISIQPLIVIANEFLDALPIRQSRLSRVGWQDCYVSCQAIQPFFAPHNPPQELLKRKLVDRSLGLVYETSSWRDRWWSAILRTLKQRRGYALMIDYGYASKKLWDGSQSLNLDEVKAISQEKYHGDTLQAVSKHQTVSVWTKPGDHDLTSHVDFNRLVQLAIGHKPATLGLTSQQTFLEHHGIRERAKALSEIDGNTKKIVKEHVARLCGEHTMGEIFKVLVVGFLDRSPRPHQGNIQET